MSIVLPQMRGILARGVAGGTDPSFANVAILCHFNGTNGSTTFTDNSVVANNPTVLSNATLTTTSPLFGSACLDVANGRIVCSDNVAYDLSTGAGTMEFSFKTATPSQTSNLLDYNNATTNTTTGFFIYISSSQFVFYFNGVDYVRGGTVATSTWQRIRWTRSAGTSYLFVDGTLIGTHADNNTYSHGDICLGGSRGGAANSTATYDEWRFTVGVARSTSSYTPDVGEFPNS